MRTVEWNLTRKQHETIFLEDRYLLVEGSAGSGKTIYAAHKILLYAYQYPNAKAYVFRQTLKANRKTAYKEIIKLLDKYQLPYHQHKTDMELTLPNGSVITFMGLDDKDKIRSINADIIYVEQAEETKKEAYGELRARVRAETSVKYYGQIILVATTESKTHWIYKQFHEKGLGKIIHFCYKDNPYLPPEFVEYLESLKDEDYELYLQLTAGRWGILTDVIYTKYDYQLSSRGYEYYTAGVDFGFNNPSCFLLTGWLDGEPYILDEVYQSKLTNSEFIDEVILMLKDNDMTPKDFDTVYCDSAEPARIKEFQQAGFPAEPADKSVKDGIDTTKRVTTHIADHCINFKREIKSYKWKKDQEGQPTDEPVKSDDHAMDAHRYNVYGELGALSKNFSEKIDADYFDEVNQW